LVDSGAVKLTDLAGFDVLPHGARPVAAWPSSDAAWTAVGADLRRLLTPRRIRDIEPASTGRVGHPPGDIQARRRLQTAPNGATQAPPGGPEIFAAPTGRPLTVLFLAASPENAVRLRLGHEVKEIRRNLRDSPDGQRIAVVEEWAVDASDLPACLLRH